jgi:ABC-2 type transport system permease protein
MLFGSFWRRNLGFFRLAVITNLEYRVNFLADAVAQPLLATLIEITLWVAIFASTGNELIAGFPKENYLGYVLWCSFVGRITSNWMYEFYMIESIESGAVNGLIVRPGSFFEYYFSQFMGYKAATTVFSLIFPLSAAIFFQLPLIWERIPAMLLLIFFYLGFVHLMSFCVACLAFKLNKVGSFTVAKNLGLWMLTGELFPLDLFPSPWKDWLIALPFANAVYVPVGYITGRVSHDIFFRGFLSTAIGIIVLGFVAKWMWRSGLKSYVGTGA